MSIVRFPVRDAAGNVGVRDIEIAVAGGPAIAITLTRWKQDTTREHVKVEFRVTNADGTPGSGPATCSVDVGSLAFDFQLSTRTRNLLAGGNDDGWWFLPLGATGQITVEYQGHVESQAYTAGVAGAPPPPPPPPVVGGVYQTDEANGTLGHFVTAGNGSNLGNQYIKVIDDPTGAFVGKVIEIDFGAGPNVADVNRAFQVEIPQPGIGYGGVIEFEGTFLIPTPQPSLVTALRKLVYLQRPQNLRPVILNHEGIEKLAAGGPSGTFRVRRTADGFAPFDTPHLLRFILQLNTGPLTPDGRLTIWLNGVQVWDFIDQPFLDTAAGFDTFKVGQQLQSQPIDKTLVYVEKRYWQRVKLTLSS